MNDEPLYTFVRGEGWILGENPNQYTYECHGKRVFAEMRKPNVGENYFYYDGVAWPEQFLNQSGEFQLKEFVKFFADRDLKYNCQFGVCLVDPDRMGPLNAIYVVFKVENV